MPLYYCVLKPLLLVESGRGVGGAEKPIGAVIPDSSTGRLYGYSLPGASYSAWPSDSVL